MKLSDQLRKILRKSGMTQGDLCRAIPLDRATMSRFLSRNGGLSIDVIDALGEILNLQIVTETTAKKSKAKKRK